MCLSMAIFVIMCEATDALYHPQHLRHGFECIENEYIDEMVGGSLRPSDIQIEINDVGCKNILLCYCMIDDLFSRSKKSHWDN